MGKASLVPGKTIRFPYSWAKQTRYPSTKPKMSPILEIKIPSLKKMEKIFLLVSPMLSKEVICFFFSINSIVSEAIKLKAERIKMKIRIQITIIFSD